ncbi:MAG TPA: PLP-dependent aminotransferase family protein [Myxococcota bacterium]|nr:PLP-dependent aminotransferase family protein [Myxococcota bacterium]HRY97069.1 PLP-dependent aminotransferase family protein [Myxococcota bacterium]HSA21450.1 PLP-dependent aminotransferase family protein [Myxococcota bacterium]
MEWDALLTRDPSELLHVRIRRGIREAVQAGELLPGEQLPGVRALAGQLGVNRLTVLKALSALSRAGVLTSSRGKGVFVARAPRSRGGPESRQARVGPFFEGVAEGPDGGPGGNEQAGDALKNVIDAALAPGSISFAAGFPPPEAIPTATIRARLGRLLREEQGAARLGYVSTQGDPGLLAALRELLAERGLRLGPDDHVLVTSGAQQALSLCLDALVQPGEALALESPGYLGAISACRLKRIPMVGVPVDAGGLNPARLESALRREDVSAVYSVPSFQNPTAVTQGLRRRRQLLELTRARGAFLIEDDIYADLRFGGHRVPPIKSLPGSERVIYLGSFSKSLAPGLRLGFLVASGELAAGLRRTKEVMDISTSALSQVLVAELLRSGFYRRHLVRVRRLYRERRDAMLAALADELPGWVRYTRPKGGLHLWVMPERPLDAGRLLARCQQEGVSFSPGSLFFCDGRRSSSLRLNYASHSPAQIGEGVRRLVTCLRKEASR